MTTPVLDTYCLRYQPVTMAVYPDDELELLELLLTEDDELDEDEFEVALLFVDDDELFADDDELEEFDDLELVDSELIEKEDELEELKVDADDVDEDELDELNIPDDELELCRDDELLLVPGMGVRRFWEKTANTVGSM